MAFNTFEYLLFLPAVFFLYYSIPHRFRWVLLLIASYYFYMSWKAEYAILIMASTLVDYFAGIRMGKLEDKKKRRPYLILSLAANLGLLFAFKYFNFFNDSLRAFLNTFNIFYGVPEFKVLLPVGISFYTFQTLSYTIDVYNGKKSTERHLGIFALYVSFFPQLVAGPIERSTNLLNQLWQKVEFDYDRIASGLRLIIWGLFKKMVIADNIAPFVDEVYANPTEYSGGLLTLATFLFAYQIYCDFSGYSDIAIGSARMLGIRLMRNFDQPYLAHSIEDFWRRWHISLSTWFRDYVYIPLGGNRVSTARLYLNLMIVFVVSGLWHGANWTFIVWGALHGGYLIAWKVIGGRFKPNSEALSEAQRHLLRYGAILLTFVLTCFAWIFFRANTVGDAFFIATNLHVGFDWLEIWDRVAGEDGLLVFLACIVIMEGVQYAHRSHLERFESWARRPVLRWAAYYAVTMAVLLLGELNPENQFIYFQF